MATGTSRLVHTLWWAVLALPGWLVLCLYVSPVQAQQPAPAQAQQPAPSAPLSVRTIRFDFETDVNRDSMPDAWKLVEGRRNRLDPKGKLSPENPHGGQFCFGIRPDGTRTTYETLETVTLDSRFTYRLTGWVKTRDVPTSGMRRTTVRIEAVLTDDVNKTPRTLSSPELTGTTAGWRQIFVHVPPSPETGPRKVRIRLVIDGIALTGMVWFDDLRLAAQPTMGMTVPRPGRVLLPGDATTLRIKLATLPEPVYALKLTVLAPDGSKVVESSHDIKPDLKHKAAVKIELPCVAFGAYKIQARLSADGIERARRDIQVGYLPRFEHTQDFAGRFGAASCASRRELPELAPALVEAGLGRMLVKVWTPDETEKDLAELTKRLDPALGRMRQDDVRPVIVLSGVPKHVALKLTAAGAVPKGREFTFTLAGMFASDEKFWLEPLKRTADGFARRAAHWQLGARPDVLLSAKDVAHMSNVVSGKLSELTPKLTLGIPVGMLQDPATIAAAHQDMDFVLFRLGQEVPADEVGSVLSRFRSGAAEQWLNVSLLDELRFGRDAQLIDLVHRAMNGLAGGASRIIVEPTVGGLFDRDGSPQDALLALATLARELDGLDYVGDLSADPDVRVLTFSRAGRTSAVIWARKPGATWTGYLGAATTLVDLWGNASALKTTEGFVTLKPAELPVILADLDSESILTQLSAAISPVELNCTTALQSVQLSLVNHFDRPISGKLIITTPPGWRVKPSEVSFQLEGAQKIQRKLLVRVGPVETPGCKQFGLRLELGADRKRILNFVRNVQLLSRGLHVGADVVRLADGSTGVQLTVTNLSKKSVRLSCFAVLAGGPRQESFINGLKANKTATRRFSWPKEVTGRKFSVGLRELDGSRFYNRIVEFGPVPDGFEEVLPSP